MKKIVFSILLFMFLVLNVSAARGRTFSINLIKPNNYEGETVYKFIDMDTEEEMEVIVEGTYKEIILPYSLTNLKVYEIARDDHYVADETVYCYDFLMIPDYTSLEHTYELKLFEVNWRAIYVSSKGDVEIGKYFPELLIYKDNEYYDTISDSLFYIEPGEYTVLDTLYNNYYQLNVFYNPTEFEIKEYIIDSIKVNTKVNSVCDQEKCYEFEQNENIILFEDILYPGEYYVNDILFTLKNGSNIELPILEDKEKEDDKQDIITIPKKDNDVIKEEINGIDNSTEEYIEVDVPNTGINSIEIIYYVKKMYFN